MADGYGGALVYGGQGYHRLGEDAYLIRITGACAVEVERLERGSDGELGELGGKPLHGGVGGFADILGLVVTGEGDGHLEEFDEHGLLGDAGGGDELGDLIGGGFAGILVLLLGRVGDDGGDDIFGDLGSRGGLALGGGHDCCDDGGGWTAGQFGVVVMKAS